MVWRSQSKNRSDNKSNKVHLNGSEVKIAIKASQEDSRLSSSMNNLLKIASAKADFDIVETKPSDVTRKEILEHRSPSSSLGNKISRSIYDLTSVERLKRWKARLPSVRNKQQQQQQILDDNDIGTISSGTLSRNQVRSPRGTNFKKLVDSSSNSRNSPSNSAIDMENHRTVTNDSLSSITVLSVSTSLPASAELDRFAEISRLTTNSTEKSDDDDRRLEINNNCRTENGNSNFENLDHSLNHHASPSDHFLCKHRHSKKNQISNRNHQEIIPPTSIADQISSTICKIEKELDKNKNNSTKYPKNNFSVGLACKNEDVYEELDCHKHNRLDSPVKLAPTSGILNEMSALPRPSAFRPFKSSKNISEPKLNEITNTNERSNRLTLYDNCTLTPRAKPPSPPPRRINGLAPSWSKDSESSSVISSSSEKPVSYQATYHQPINHHSSPNNQQVQQGFYKSFVEAKVEPACKNDSSTHVVQQNANGGSKTFSRQSRFPVSNHHNYVLPSSTTDSGVSMQNYSAACSFSSRSSGMSDSGVAELENVCKDKDTELNHLRQSMEQNEQVIVQVYQEKEHKWQNKLKQWSARVEQSIEVEQKLLGQIENLKDEQNHLHRKVQTLSSEKHGLQRKCKELESELFTLKQQINEKRKHWEICRDCGKIYVPESSCPEKQNGMNSATLHPTTPSLDGTMSTKAPTVSEELRSEMDLLKQEVTNVKSALQQQIDKFSHERQMWEDEKRQVLQCHKILEDNYGWLVHNHSRKPETNLKSSFREFNSKC